MDSSTRAPPSDLPEDHREVSVLHITDPTAVGEMLEDYGMDVINLDPGEFEYKQVTVPLDECVLIYQHTNSELCEAAHVSERTLQEAFKEIMGMSPVTYLHRLRLHRARDELRKAESGATSVTDVALNWGFWHFGEFSRAYKNCFGEVPSNTLRQQ